MLHFNALPLFSPGKLQQLPLQAYKTTLPLKCRADQSVLGGLAFNM